MNVTDKTSLNMVIGYPLKHTQSPVLHNTVYQLLGMDAILIAKPHANLKPLIQVIKTLSVELTAVTHPYKEQVIPYLDQCSPEASALQAVNTIIQRQGKLKGYNTDINGIAFALADIKLQGKQVLLIGAGGAARAMAYFLKKNKARIMWLNRTKKKANALANEFGGDVITPNKLNQIDIDIIINTTPVGLYPHINATPLPYYTFHSNQVVFDMVYNPVSTKLLKQAKSRRAKIITGLEMFIGQGLKQIELLTGKRIHTQSMVESLRKTLIQNQRVAYP